ELFGHVRGAFTDAKNPRRGVLFEADGGTLFLDEVGELPLPIQAKLLRALQERRVRPLGAEAELPFDVRVVAASNRNLSAEVEAGRFRADLYYRLQGVEGVVPPLRSRGNDILLLAQHFVEKAALRMGKGVRGISAEAAARLMSWRWPGNVRELSNVMERAVALCPGTEVQVSELPEGMQRRAGGAEPVGEEEELLSLEEVEKRHILRVLAAVGGSKASAARVLGLDRATLYRRLERYGER
ncbi:MAG TPA: sigma 54-interacting transcriptional regulator, partial [Myxococcota bacterium]|nr:sigma 54-interacting transcriptional regulator [Myxococcota bacterium]